MSGKGKCHGVAFYFRQIDGKGEALPHCSYCNKPLELDDMEKYVEEKARLLEWFDFCIEESKKDGLPRFYSPIEERAIEQIRQLIQQKESLMSVEEALALVVSILEDYEPKISIAVVEKCYEAVAHVAKYNSHDREQEARAMVYNAFQGIELEEEE